MFISRIKTPLHVLKIRGKGKGPTFGEATEEGVDILNNVTGEIKKIPYVGDYVEKLSIPLKAPMNIMNTIANPSWSNLKSIVGLGKQRRKQRKHNKEK